MKAAIIDFNRTLFDPEKNKLIEGAIPLLQFLKSKKVVTVLLTREESEREDKIKFISCLFNRIVVVKEKTQKEFENIISLLKMDSSEIVVIGDYIKEEITFGNRLGMTTIRVRQGKFADEGPSTPDEKASITVSGLAEVVPEVISFLNSPTISTSKMDIQTAKGVRDIPPQEKILKNKVVATLQEIFELYGFSPLETPTLERYETLSSKFAAGDASDALKETFKLKDQGDRDLGLRFDLTVPLARFIAMNPNLKMPFKRYEMGTVFRDGPIKLGRYREFWQCDVDTIGSKSMLVEAEILAVMQTAFAKLGLDVTLKVNNRKLLNGILEQAGIKDGEPAIIAIDKLDKIGKEGVTKELLERGYNKKEIESLFSYIKEGITLKELKNKIKSQSGEEGIKELEELFVYLKELGVLTVFDISLARGLAYYTGTVYEAYLKKGTITSSLAGGGRWDNMIGKFLGGSRDVPAVGVAFGVEPIMDTLKQLQKEVKKTPTKVYVVPIQTVSESLKLVTELRTAGIPTSMDLVGKGVSKNLDYASSLGIPYVIILGSNEVQKKKVLLRDMSSGEQQELTVKEVVKKLQ